jgi:hypothetical protein
MSVEKKEAYLKKRCDYYHKRKANMKASAAEGLHLHSSRANPRVTNVSTQLAQPSNQLSEITDS